MKTKLDEILQETSKMNCNCLQCSKLKRIDGKYLLNEFIGPSQDLEVIGNDSRKMINQVSNIINQPFRWICHLTVNFRHPQTSQMVRRHGGTGLLISPCHVLTVGHNLHLDVNIRIPNGATRIERVAASYIDVSPGRDGSSRPFGTCRSKHIVSHENWEKYRHDNFDYGIITLREKVGNKNFKVLNNQPLGHWGQLNTYLTPTPKSGFANKVVNIGGYPRDIGNDNQWIAYDKVIDVNPITANGNRPVPELFLHFVDTCFGQSGAPIWKFDENTKRRDLIGIHKATCEGIKDCRKVSGRSCDNSGRDRLSSNLGVWFSPVVYSQVQAWMAKYPC